MRKVVNAILLDKANKKILIIKRKSNDLIHPKKWSFPGGEVKKGETYEQALKREIKEEVGIQIKKIIKKISTYQYSGKDNILTTGISYSVIPLSVHFHLTKEIDDVKWVTIEELEKLDYIQGIDEEATKSLFN